MGSLDLRSYKFNTAAAVSLSSRCKNLRRLKLRSADSADAIVSLQARELRELSSDLCCDMRCLRASDSAQISSEAIKALAYCCSRLKRLWMSGVREANGDAINALAKHCRQLIDIGFVESNNFDDVAIGNLSSLNFLSVAGTRNLKWGSAAQVWSELPNLVGLDVSRTDSSQEEVQERAATVVATFLVIHNKNATIDCQRTEAILRGDGAIANMSVDSKVAKIVADSGGINVLTSLARSKNRLVGCSSVGAIAESDGVTVLVDLILKRPSGTDLLLQRATGALANLAADEKCSKEMASAVGIHALAMLALTCKFECVKEQAARALSNLAAYGDCDSNSAAIGQEAGALESLVQLTYSQIAGLRQQAATALWNLSFDEKNREVISAVGGIEALVALARSSISASKSLQERVAGALWALLLSGNNRIAIGRQGGIAPLIALACSDVEDIHLLAAGALWNLDFYHDNALRIIQDDGVQPLVHLCCSSNSKMARFMAALALVYTFDEIVDVAVAVEYPPSSPGSSKMKNIDGVGRLALKHVEEFVISSFDPQAFNVDAASTLVPTALAQIAEAIRIPDAGHIRCSGAEIDRYVRVLGGSCSILKSCSAFVLFCRQAHLTLPGGRYTMHHSGLLEKAGAGRVLRYTAEASAGPIQAKIFTKIVLRNLENTMKSQLSSKLRGMMIVHILAPGIRKFKRTWGQHPGNYFHLLQLVPSLSAWNFRSCQVHPLEVKQITAATSCGHIKVAFSFC
ncbi:Protein ARABIDILLO 2 [Hibiscus syriacus]|uniref:Protein ARABIDILLO 2 n=1 Tax=Hibiscus syriacus TaxID=106335 RepID=A0A6A2WW09_HIBSY|nr:Protein ARABIDILLO 2 [Hibiscus syriacus]